MCKTISVNRSSYYKWKKRKRTLNRYKKIDRNYKTIGKTTNKHSVYGYHSFAKVIREQTG